MKYTPEEASKIMFDRWEIQVAENREGSALAEVLENWQSEDDTKRFNGDKALKDAVKKAEIEGEFNRYRNDNSRIFTT